MNKCTLTIDEVANFFQVTPKTIRVWVKEKKFPAPMKLSRTIRWTPEKIEEFINQKNESNQ